MIKLPYHPALLFVIATTWLACNIQPHKQSFQIPAGNSSIDTFILQQGESLLNENKLPGIFVAITDNGKRNYYNFGFADIENKKSFDSLIIFEAGSITKTFTAHVLKKVLAEKGIHDSLPVKTYLPEGLAKNEMLAGVTFLSLMNHTSGLARIPDNMPVDINNRQPYENYTTEKLFDYLRKTKLNPDLKSRYSNTGFALCGILAENISGKKYEDLLTQFIFSPLDIHAYLNVPDTVTHVSQGYFEKIKTGFWKFDCMAPAGAIKCSARDLLQYLEYMYNHSDDPLIGSLLQPTVQLNENISVCRAWHTMKKEGQILFYWHNGGTYGFSTFAAFSKEKRKGVVVVVNKFNANEVSDGLGINIMHQWLN